QMKGQAFVATTMVVVSADELVAGFADQNRAGHQFKGLSPSPIAEAALAHVGQGEAVMDLDKRLLGGACSAPVVDDRHGAASQLCSVQHDWKSLRLHNPPGNRVFRRGIRNIVQV